jgi:hypothetical protein
LRDEKKRYRHRDSLEGERDKVDNVKERHM